MKIREISRRLPLNLSKAYLLLLLGQIPLLGQANLETIVQRSVEALKRDWVADRQFDYTERDQEKGGSKTYEVTMLSVLRISVLSQSTAVR